jgi:repressor LexA
MDIDLTRPQQLVLRFIEERLENGQPPPTYREICQQFGYKSPKAAADHVAALEKKGRIKREKGCSRGLRLTRKKDGIPLFGSISAGYPRDALSENGQRLVVDPRPFGILDPAKAFALRVKGDSMVGRQIFDGDIVVIDGQAEPKSNDIVAALIDNESTLKTFIKEGAKVWLRAENSKYSDLIPAFDLKIQGVARFVIHSISA